MVTLGRLDKGTSHSLAMKGEEFPFTEPELLYRVANRNNRAYIYSIVADKTDKQLDRLDRYSKTKRMKRVYDFLSYQLKILTGLL